MLISHAFSLATLIVTATAATTSTSSCNPVKSSSCSPDSALGGSIQEDFNDGLGSYFTNSGNQGNVTTSDEGLSLTINKRYDNPSVHSNFYLMFGYVEVELKAAEGKGIVSSFFMQSDDLDEIDIELFGGDEYEWQSNYFVQGNTSTYDRGGYHQITPNPLTNYHKYAINWTKDSLDWIVDGSVIRSLKITNSQGYPQTPMRIYAGIWAGGDPSNEEGTIEWAGGETDYSDVPFTMHIKSITAIDYSTGSEYSYSDQSGYWQSIDAEDGEVNGRYSDAQSDISKVEDGESIENSGSSGSSSTSETSSSTESSSSESSSSSSASSSSDQASSTQDSSSSSESEASVSTAGTTNESSGSTSAAQSTNNAKANASTASTASSASTASVSTRESSSAKSETTTSSSETASVSSSSESSATGITPSRPMLLVTFLVSFVSLGVVLV
ncbi:CRH1 [Candida margitis]|uniref:CRH1 n=1 Tax=Candida margitis TaxID=1775924 RepID=UPI002226C10B|nr:CRH1 [Candida margitis]KAI5970039.1 CRH1 [Candida margitis]